MNGLHWVFYAAEAAADAGDAGGSWTEIYQPPVIVIVSLLC